MTTTLTRERPHVRAAGRPRVRRRGGGAVPTTILLLGAFYMLLPVLWVVVASTKNLGELFDSSAFTPSGHLFENLSRLSSYRDGVYWHWVANSALYAGGGALLSAAVSGISGYALAKFRFAGKTALFNVLLCGVLMPQIMLAIPQYLLLSKLGLADTYASVLLPQIISPYGIYLARIYAGAAIPDSVLEAARMDGAREFQIVRRVVLPMMAPGLVTVFLFQFVAIWNNFLLPFIMLGDDTKFPVTVGLFTMMKQGANQPAQYTLITTGVLLAILPMIALFLTLQRYWRVDLGSGAVKG
ncbi:carbohydrate ABC transporter permease [Actinocorallia longicatena]|uniref:Carbohydrate ABC transporter permease n=1 Tax=Actinocorallia longicatena TaxID=111803 RepID=A0ABP6PVZ0_9ACTN